MVLLIVVGALGVLVGDAAEVVLEETAKKKARLVRARAGMVAIQ